MIFLVVSKKSLKKMIVNGYCTTFFVKEEKCILEHEEIIADIVFLAVWRFMHGTECSKKRQFVEIIAKYKR